MGSTNEHSNKGIETVGGIIKASGTEVEMPPKNAFKKPNGNYEIEIVLQNDTIIRDNDKKVIFRVDSNGNLISRTPEKLSKDVLRELAKHHPECKKYLKEEELSSIEKVEER